MSEKPLHTSTQKLKMKDNTVKQVQCAWGGTDGVERVNEGD
jgi:hypothetical protein